MVDETDVKGGRALILVGPAYEDLEAWYPRLRFMEAGLEVTIGGIGDKEYTGKKGHKIAVDADASELVGETFDILVVVGGFAPDAMRMNESVLQIVRDHMQKSVVAVVCHGPWVLVSAGVLEGRTVTGFKSLKDDLENAGAKYLDQEVVVDGNLVTSRHPFDLPAFCREALNLLAKRVAPGQAPG